MAKIKWAFDQDVFPRERYMAFNEGRGLVMDEMKLNLSSNFLRKIASKLIVRYIRKHFEVNTELDLEELKIDYKDGDVVIRTNLELKMKASDTHKLLSKLEED